MNLQQTINALTYDQRRLILELFSRKFGTDTAGPACADQVAAMRAATFKRMFGAPSFNPAARGKPPPVGPAALGASIQDLVGLKIVRPHPFMDTGTRLWFWRFTEEGLQIANAVAEASR